MVLQAYLILSAGNAQELVSATLSISASEIGKGISARKKTSSFYSAINAQDTKLPF